MKKVKFTEEYKVWSKEQAKKVNLGEIPFDLDGTYEVVRENDGGKIVRVKFNIGDIDLSIKNSSLIEVE